MVTASHVDGGFLFGAGFLPHPTRFNQGAAAVIGFYVLSGYLMTFILTQKFALITSSLRRTFTFFLDRVIRLYPLYIFFTIIAFIVKTNMGFHPFVSVPKIIDYLVILPLNYYRTRNIYMFMEDNLPLLGPTWSLALELHFYLLVPFIYRHDIVRFLIWISSLGYFFWAAGFSSDPLYRAYLLFPGMAFAFLTGSFLYSYNHTKKRRYSLAVVISWLAVLLFTFFIISNHAIDLGRNLEVVTGYLLAVPTVSFLSFYSPNHYLDKFAGGIAYPVFLSHWIFVEYYKRTSLSLERQHLLVIIFSLISSLLSYLFIEKVFDRLRHHLISRLIPST